MQCNKMQLQDGASGGWSDRDEAGATTAVCTHVRTYVHYVPCWRKISNYCFTALAIFKTILVFFGVVEAPQDYGRGGYTYLFMNKISVIYVYIH